MHWPGMAVVQLIKLASQLTNMVLINPINMAVYLIKVVVQLVEMVVV
jgi:hypothetical protein